MSEEVSDFCFNQYKISAGDLFLFAFGVKAVLLVPEDTMLLIMNLFNFVLLFFTFKVRHLSTSSFYIEVNDGNGNINNVYTPGILEAKVKKKKLSAKKLDQLRHEYPHMSDFEDVESI